MFNANSIYSETGIVGTSQHKRLTFCCHQGLGVHILLSCLSWGKAAIIYLLKWEILLKTQNDCCTAARRRVKSPLAYQGTLCHWLQELRNFPIHHFISSLTLYMIINCINHWVNEGPLKSAVKVPMITQRPDFDTLNNNTKQRFNLS